MTPDGHAKILDFGLAKLVEPDGRGARRASRTWRRSRRRRPASSLGTLRYMSPEQARGQAVDHRSDIFSLGVLLYEMVTGQLPFSGSTALDTLHAIAFEETRPVTALRPEPAAVAAADHHPLPAQARAGPLPRRRRSWPATSRPCSARSRAASRARRRSRVQLQERWQSLRDRTLGEWLLPALVVVVALAVAISLFFVRSHEVGPGAFMLGLAGALHLAPHPQPAAPARPQLREEGHEDARGAAGRPRRHALHRCSPTARRRAPTCARTPCSTRSTPACSSATRSRW